MSVPALSDEWTIGRLLEWTQSYFAKHHIEPARLEVELLLAHVLDCSRIQLYTHYDVAVDEGHRRQFRECVRQRVAGCPSAYLTGAKEFYSRRFDVTPSTLIPRPETEHVVEAALGIASRQPLESIADVGTGSGILGVTLACELPHVKVTALDIDADCLDVAARNAVRHGVDDRMMFVRSDLFRGLEPGTMFDMVVSNPPYVATNDWEALADEVRRFEPRRALDGGFDGLDIIRRLVKEAVACVRASGWLILEFGFDQAARLRELVGTNGAWRVESMVRDLAGRERVAVLQHRDMSPWPSR